MQTEVFESKTKDIWIRSERGRIYKEYIKGNHFFLSLKFFDQINKNIMPQKIY
jgi:dimeric dUTPase (all-alpha-NTP-PPase superfamily)